MMRIRRDNWIKSAHHYARGILVRKYWLIKCKNEHYWVFLNFAIILILLMDIEFRVFKNYYSFCPALAYYLELVLLFYFILNCCTHVYLLLWRIFNIPLSVPLNWASYFAIPCEGAETKKWHFFSLPESKYQLPGNLFWNYDIPFFALPPLSPLEQFMFCKSMRLPVQSRFRNMPKYSKLEPKEPNIRPDDESLIWTQEDLDKYFIKCMEREREAFVSKSFAISSLFQHWIGFIRYRFFLAVKGLGKTLTHRFGQPLSKLEKMILTLKNLRYQHYLPPLSPLDDNAPDECSSNVWRKLGVSEETLTVWADRMRQYMCSTIISQLIQEIDLLNKALCQSGFTELEVGMINLFTLRQMAIAKKMMFPKLPLLVPYLEASENQPELLKRFRELADERTFGGYTKLSSPSKNLPHDSKIFMHLFCAYMDSLLPTDIITGTKKYFTNNYYMAVPDKPVYLAGKNYIYLVKEDFPRYTVIIDHDVFGVPKGHNHVFFAIVLLIHYLRLKDGKIGPMSLGESGFNILHVVD